VARTIASAYLAKSNIIRKREIGRCPSIAFDQRLMRCALPWIARRGHDDQLRGVIFFASAILISNITQ